MTNKELKKQEEDLEKQLNHQLDVLKKESESWAKVGGAVLAGGLVSYGATKLIRGKSKKKAKKKLIKEMKDEGHPIKVRKPRKHKASLMSSVGKRLFIVALSLGQAKLIDILSKKATDASRKV
ncbi:hypothetical protein IFO69_20050 [Echinicola sp. CAU 1574]|uniref:Uncharacterized protein n=1 Tax=Echinicola arenosa TaxID=2774144 RepID=A0ABR9ARS0_9BACT|nr:hypothetical protein [Echinicola arenosa]MBD8491057.1 hypothetical protein [Echinicola arenosa]